MLNERVMDLNIKDMHVSFIAAVGTSLLTQYPKYCKDDELGDYQDFVQMLDSEAEMESDYLKVWEQRIAQTLSWDKCAELNSIQCFVNHYKVGDYSVKLISSDTSLAKFSSKIITKYLLSEGIITRQQISVGLIYDGTDRFSRIGFPSLISNIKISIDLSKTEGYLPVLNSTPGFKAETSIMTLMGAITNTPVFYMHEKMDRPFLLPAMPVSLSKEIWKRWNKLVKAVKLKETTKSGTMSAQEYSGYIKQHQILDGDFLFEEYDNGITLSTLGYIFHEAYCPITSENKLKKSKVSPENRIVISKAPHHHPKGTYSVARNIAGLNFVESVASKEFRDSPVTRILSRYNKEKPGEIFVQWSDKSKAVILPIKTTAINEIEHSIARQSIEELLEIESIDIDKNFIRPEELFRSDQVLLIDRLSDYSNQIVSYASEIEQLNEIVSKLSDSQKELEHEINDQKNIIVLLEEELLAITKMSVLAKIKNIFI